MTPSPLQRWLMRPWFLTLWCVVAAFGSYGCMYGFRKPFTAGTFAHTPFGAELKTWFVIAQVLGYMLSKFIGIKVIAEMPPGRRVRVFLLLIGIAEAALLLFAITPPPWSAAWLFFNGLPLGLVFGLVLGFVEGRRMTEIFIAGLCASFILADGFAKSVGSALLIRGVSEAWMPVAAGGIFAAPLLLFVWMLQQIPAPDAGDVAARSERTPMSGAERWGMLRRHGVRLLAIILVYLLMTVLRSVRADFAPEIWAGLGVSNQPAVFTISETWVALGVVAASAALVLVKNNRRAFLLALAISAAAPAIALLSLAGRQHGALSPFAFMVLLGLGMYVPYVAVHTTLFERLIALTRERANMCYLMYLADAAGYLGYVGVLLGKNAFPTGESFLSFFTHLSTWTFCFAVAALLLAYAFYARNLPREKAVAVEAGALPSVLAGE
jgi:hypothetical protein